MSHATIIDTELEKTNPEKRTLILLAQELNDDFGLAWLRAHVKEVDATITIEARVAAGEPIEFLDEKDSISVDPRMIRHKGRHFGLRVDGDSMEDAHILSGDIIIVRQNPEPSSRDLVVADVRAEGITLKRWKKEGDEVVLTPESGSHKPLRRPAWRVKPVGIVVGVIRLIR